MPAGNPAGYDSPRLRMLLEQMMGARQAGGPFAPGVPRGAFGGVLPHAFNSGDRDLAAMMEQVSPQPAAVPSGNPFPQGDPRAGAPLGAEPGWLEWLLGPSFAAPSKAMFDANQSLRPAKKR